MNTLNKIFVIFVLFFGLFGSVAAHDFNEEAMTYILSNPDATWSDFEAQVETFDDPELEEKMQETNAKLTVVLSLSGKKYVANYATANPDFSYTDIKELIADDPMLSEIGAEVIYSFLSERLQKDKNYMSWDYFRAFLKIGFQHIMGGLDHILFILTLIICLPRTKRILSIITTFTIAHSITIILGGMQIVSLPSTVVEPAIVISIILMAGYAMLQKLGEEKQLIPEVILIFTLGLFHGLGFAGFFREILDVSTNIAFPILAFNVGVELGQILIILIGLAVLHLTYKLLPNRKELIKNGLGIIFIVMAAYWLFQMVT